MDLKHRRIVAISFILIMLTVPLTAIQLQDDSDSDANPIVSGAIRGGTYVAKHWKQIANFLSGIFMTVCHNSVTAFC